MAWNTKAQPFGVNRAPLLTGLASDDSGVSVPVAVDPDTGAILTEGGGGSGGGTSSTFGAAFPTTGTAVGATDGTDMQPLKVDDSDNLLVKINTALPAGSNVIGHVITDSSSTTAVTQATAASLNATVVGTGTFAVQAAQATAASLNATVVGTGTFAVQAAGPTTSGSSLTASPLTIGGLAKTANPTAVTDGQVVNGLYDKLGKTIAVGSIRTLKVNQITTITSSASETTVLTQVASTFLDVYGCIVTNTSATSVTVAFKDSTSGTTQFNIAVPAGDTRGFMLPEGGAIKQGTINNNWTATTQSVASVIITMLAVQNI